MQLCIACMATTVISQLTSGNLIMMCLMDCRLLSGTLLEVALNGKSRVRDAAPLQAAAQHLCSLATCSLVIPPTLTVSVVGQPL